MSFAENLRILTNSVVESIKIDNLEIFGNLLDNLPINNNPFSNNTNFFGSWSNFMIDNNITPLGVRTDCVLFEPTENINKLFNFDNVIGGYKLEHDKELISTRIDRYDNELLDILNLEPEIKEIKDEFDNKEFT